MHAAVHPSSACNWGVYWVLAGMGRWKSRLKGGHIVSKQIAVALIALVTLCAGGSTAMGQTNEKSVTEGMSREQLLSLMGKPERAGLSKCSGGSPGCPAGHKNEIFAYPAVVVGIVDGRVWFVQRKNAIPTIDWSSSTSNSISSCIDVVSQWLAPFKPGTESVVTGSGSQPTPVALSQRTLEEYLDALKLHDTYGAANLLKQRQVVILDQNTKVLMRWTPSFGQKIVHS